MFQHTSTSPTARCGSRRTARPSALRTRPSGTYFDEDHGLSDFGARWHDAEHGVLRRGPGGVADPMVQLTDPGSVRSYAFAGNNPLANADPDGTAWYR